MVVKQKIEIKIKDKERFIGTLSITSKIKGELQDTFVAIEPKKIKGKLFEHIGKDKELNNYAPIQFCPLATYSTDIFLLEETNYLISFVVNKNLPNKEELIIFNHLKKNSEGKGNFSFNHLNDVWFANINFRGFAGKTFIDIIYGDFKYSLMVEVRTKKLDYENEYSEMISDLSGYSSGLLFNINASLYQSHGDSGVSQSTVYEYYMLLEYLFRPQNLPSVVEYLSRNLYSLLDNKRELVPTAFASNIGADEIVELSSNPQQLHQTTEKYSIFTDDNDDHYIPLMIKDMSYADNIDVPENRFYKFFLEYILDTILKALKTKPGGQVELTLKRFYEDINLFLSHRYFNNISQLDYIPLNSQVLQKKEGYREILEYYLMFEFGLRIKFKELDTDDFRGFGKELSALYEIWCYFELIDILNKLTNSYYDFNKFIDVDSWSLSLESIKNLDYFNIITIGGVDVKITLMYNYSFLHSDTYGIGDFSSYSEQLDPDYTLLIEYGNEKKFIHFDAKYKLDKNDCYKKEDIYKMHTYKDGINNSIGAYILYPSNKKPIIFKETDGSFGSVGAFSLKPNTTKNYKIAIRKFIKEIIEDLIYLNS